MLHPAKAGVKRAAAAARRALARRARPAGAFDASRYFRGDATLGFYNVGTPVMRRMAHAMFEAHRDEWSVGDALAFADLLIKDRHLEAKSIGIELLARYRRAFTPGLLPVWKRWLARNDSANWATTDAMCGALIGPLLASHPPLVARVAGWAGDRNMWVRRASAVSLVGLARKGVALEAAYGVARRLHADREDLIRKAVGWLLREAGKTDPARLERYLRRYGPAIPRTTVRYAIERFPVTTRQELMTVTRAPAEAPAAVPARKRVSARRAMASASGSLEPSAGGGFPAQ
jgi:3-methyladenine DNA glycosylase AlkD